MKLLDIRKTVRSGTNQTALRSWSRFVWSTLHV